MKKYTIIYDINLLRTTATNINDSIKFVKFLNQNYTFLWLEHVIPLQSDDIQYVQIYYSLEDGKKKITNIKSDFRHRTDIITCPTVVIDFECNRDKYWGYDEYIDIDTSMRVSLVQSIVDYGDLLYRILKLWWNTDKEQQYNFCGENFYQQPIKYFSKKIKTNEEESNDNKTVSVYKPSKKRKC